MAGGGWLLFVGVIEFVQFEGEPSCGGGAHREAACIEVEAARAQQEPRTFLGATREGARGAQGPWGGIERRGGGSQFGWACSGDFLVFAQTKATGPAQGVRSAGRTAGGLAAGLACGFCPGLCAGARGRARCFFPGGSLRGGPGAWAAGRRRSGGARTLGRWRGLGPEIFVRIGFTAHPSSKTDQRQTTPERSREELFSRKERRLSS